MIILIQLLCLTAGVCGAYIYHRDTRPRSAFGVYVCIFAVFVPLTLWAVDWTLDFKIADGQHDPSTIEICIGVSAAIMLNALFAFAPMAVIRGIRDPDSRLRALFVPRDPEGPH